MEYYRLPCLDFLKNNDEMLDQKRVSLFSSYLVRKIPLPSQRVGVETKGYVIETLGKIETAVVIIFLLWNRVLTGALGTWYSLIFLEASGFLFCL